MDFDEILPSRKRMLQKDFNHKKSNELNFNGAFCETTM